MVEEQIGRAKSKNRKCLIYQNKRQISNDKVRLIFTHNEKNPPIHQWIRQGRKFLDRNEKAKEMGKNIQIAYRQPKNLKKLVGGPKSKGGGGDRAVVDVGCSRCKKKCNQDRSKNISKHQHKKNLSNKTASQLPKSLHNISWYLPKMPGPVCRQINPTVHQKTLWT